MNMKHVYLFFLIANIIETIIMDEICRQFPIGTMLQYACVSRDYIQSATTTSRTIYIQIILKKVVNKNGWFLDKITGMYNRHRT